MLEYPLRLACLTRLAYDAVADHERDVLLKYAVRNTDHAVAWQIIEEARHLAQTGRGVEAGELLQQLVSDDQG